MSRHDSKVPVHSLDIPKVSTIEYNLNIHNIDKAVELTGGQETIKEKIKHGLPLEFRYRPEDKYSHPIEGNVIQCDSVILKIKVNKKILHERFQGDLKKYLGFMNNEQKREYENLQKQQNEEKRKTDKFLSDLQVAASKKTKDAENDEMIKNLDDNIENVSREDAENMEKYGEPIEQLPLIVEPVAISNKTYRFRELADYQYITKNDKFRQQVEESILSGDYEKIKEIKFEKEKYPWSASGDRPLKNTILDLVPPPTFTSIKIPIPYKYTHNNYAVPMVDPKTGETQLVAGNRVASLNSRLIPADGKVPMKRDIRCTNSYFLWKQALVKFINKYSEEYRRSSRKVKLFQWTPETLFDDKRLILNDNVLNQEEADIIISDPEYRKPLRYLQCVTFITKLIDEEKIISRVKLYALAPQEYTLYIKRSIPFAAYSFRNGPFRSMLIKYGTDPRASKDFMPSQMESYRVVGVYNMTSEIVIRKKFMNKGHRQYSNLFFVFDGKQFPNMLSFNIEDLKDPDILKIFDLNKDILYAEKFTVKYGWLNPKVAENIRNIMRIKLPFLYKGMDPPAERIATYVVRVNNEEDEEVKHDHDIDAGGDAEIDDDEDDDDDEFDEDVEGVEADLGSQSAETVPLEQATANSTKSADEDIIMQDAENDIEDLHHDAAEGENEDEDMEYVTENEFEEKNRRYLNSDDHDLLEEIKKSNPKMYEKLVGLNGILKSDSYETVLRQ